MDEDITNYNQLEIYIKSANLKMICEKKLNIDNIKELLNVKSNIKVTLKQDMISFNLDDHLMEYFTGLVNENKHINNNKKTKLYEKINILKTIQNKNKCNERLSIEEHIFLRENLSSEEI